MNPFVAAYRFGRWLGERYVVPPMERLLYAEADLLDRTLPPLANGIARATDAYYRRIARAVDAVVTRRA